MVLPEDERARQLHQLLCLGWGLESGLSLFVLLYTGCFHGTRWGGGVSFQTRATPPTVKTEERQHGTPATHLSIANFPPERSPKTLWALTVEDNDVQLTSDENSVIVFRTKDFVFQVASRDLPSCSLSQQLHPSLSQPIVS